MFHLVVVTHQTVVTGGFTILIHTFGVQFIFARLRIKMAQLQCQLGDIRKLDPYGIFIKERGFAPGEPYRCRATRRGGARPGFHNLESEDKMLLHIASALRALDKGEIPLLKQKKKKLDVEKLKEIIKGTEVVQ